MDPSRPAIAIGRIPRCTLRCLCPPAWWLAEAPGNCAAHRNRGAIPAWRELGLPDRDLRSGDVDALDLLVSLPCHRPPAAVLDLPGHHPRDRPRGEIHDRWSRRGHRHRRFSLSLAWTGT